MGYTSETLAWVQAAAQATPSHSQGAGRVFIRWTQQLPAVLGARFPEPTKPTRAKAGGHEQSPERSSPRCPG